MTRQINTLNSAILETTHLTNTASVLNNCPPIEATPAYAAGVITANAHD